jgi:lipid II:glycine glycyltransferase (peptidoglycan interpeptide bridge formation enzyme)
VSVDTSANANWQVEVDQASPTEWAAMLDLFSDANIYQTWSYGAVRWGSKNLSHLVLKRDGQVAGIAQLRIVRPTPLKFGMAYLRWGPLCDLRKSSHDVEAAGYLFQALRDEYVVKRKLMLQVLPNAFIGSERQAVLEPAFSRFGRETRIPGSYRTLLLDLSPSLHELRKNLDAKWRNKLTQSEKNGLSVIVGNTTRNFSTFCSMYHEMRNRKSFETTVGVEEFGRLLEELPDKHRLQIFICERGGKPVAGVVVSAMGDSAIYLLGATSDDGLNAKGAYLLQWRLIQWLKEKAIRWYDLGGIDPEGNPGVYSFKKGLSGADVRHLATVTACENVLSSATVKVALALQGAAQKFKAMRYSRATGPVKKHQRTPQNISAGALPEEKLGTSKACVVPGPPLIEVGE